ncbi:hypothetical protein HanIR_Chr06g0292051 [Helianthus annuus]|nr:hypothetical protein HanIR_Chr06g0292051 [Helianthus annuus]
MKLKSESRADCMHEPRMMMIPQAFLTSRAMSTWTRAWKGNGSTVNTEAMHELGRTR